MTLDLYLLAAIAAIPLMCFLVFAVHGVWKRLVLVAFAVIIVAAFVWLVVPLGAAGFQVAWFLLFPFFIAFMGLALAFMSHRILKLGLLCFASVLSVGVIVLDAFFLFGQLPDPQAFASESFAKFTFLITETLIVLASVVLALVVSLIAFVVRLLLKRER